MNFGNRAETIYLVIEETADHCKCDAEPDQWFSDFVSAGGGDSPVGRFASQEAVKIDDSYGP